VVPGMPDDGRAVALPHRGSRLARSRFVTNSEPVAQANGSPSLPPCEAIAPRLRWGGARRSVVVRSQVLTPSADARASSRAAVWSAGSGGACLRRGAAVLACAPACRLRAGVLLTAGGDGRASRLAVMANGAPRVLSRRVRGQSGYALPIGDGVAP
jgi:hypothetical protein